MTGSNDESLQARWDALVKGGNEWEDLTPEQRKVCDEFAQSQKPYRQIGSTGIFAADDGEVIFKDFNGDSVILSQAGVALSVTEFLGALSAVGCISPDAAEIRFSE